MFHRLGAMPEGDDPERWQEHIDDDLARQWEQRRYEIAKAAIQGLCSGGSHFELSNEGLAKYAVELADALLARLEQE